MSEILHAIAGIPWFAWIAIVAIISGCVTGLANRHYQHLERLEMIRQGMNPDARSEASKPLGVRDF